LGVHHHRYSFLSDKTLTSTDYSGGSEVRTVSNGSAWGQTPQWMANATTLTNNQQYSQPSSAYSYSNQNITVDVGLSSSTPASSTADVLSRNTQNMGHYRCNVQGCNHTRIFTKETALMRHQEIKHADLFPPQITYACEAAECAANRYGTLERLNIHIRCKHPEALESPAQLPTLSVSDRGTQPDRRAQVNEFLAGEYIPGMEDNPIAIPDQRTLGEIYPLTIGNLRPGKSSGGAHRQRVYREPCMRRSTSPMPNQLSARTVDEPAHKLQGQFSITSSNHGMGFTTTASNAPFRRPQHAREGLSNFNGQLQSHTHHTNSPTSSLPHHFANSMQISNQSHPFQICSDIEKEVQTPAIQPDHLGIFATTNTAPLDASATLVEDWRPEDHSMMAFNTHTLNPYGNLGDTQPEISFQAGYIGSDMGVPAWSGHDRSTSIARTSGFNSDYAPPGFQSGTQDTHCLTNNATSPSFLVLPGDATRPMITLSGADFAFTPNTFSSDQILSQPNSLPNLVHGNFSSSGASESVVSPVEAPNTFNDNFREDWDACSNFFNDFSNIEIVGRPSFIAAKDSSANMMLLQNTSDEA